MELKVYGYTRSGARIVNKNNPTPPLKEGEKTIDVSELVPTEEMQDLLDYFWSKALSQFEDSSQKD